MRSTLNAGLDMDDKKIKDMDFEIDFYERILAEKGDFLQALMALGDLYTKRGFYEKGLAIDKRLVQLQPEDPYVLYNLACSYSLLNQLDKARQVIKLAILSGYSDWDFLEKDTDLINLLKDDDFKQYLSKMKMARPMKQVKLPRDV
jgi:tetratricopeptide (TPR) repeat protein